MRLNLRTFHKGLILIGLPLIINVLLVAVLFYLVVQSDNERQEEYRQKKIYECSARMGYLLFDLVYTLNNIFLSKDVAKYAQVKQELFSFVKARTELMSLVDRDPVTSARFRKMITTDNPLYGYFSILQDLANHRLNLITFRDTVEKAKKDAIVASTRVSGTFGVIIAESENYLLNSPKKQAAIRQMQLASLLGGMLLNIAAAFFLVRFFMTDIVHRLNVMKENSERLAKDESLQPELSGFDEIAELDHAFHRVADELKLAAQRERAAFDKASDVICALDSRGHFTRINAACERLFGYRPDRLIGQNLLDLVADEDKDRTSKALGSTQTISPSTTFESTIIRSDDKPLSTLWSIYWSATDDALFCVVHDITERKQSEQLKKEFLSMVRQNLQIPLRAISGVFQQFTNRAFGELPELASNKITMAGNNITRLLKLVDELFKVEQMESTTLELDRQDVAVVDLLQESVQEIESLAEKRGIKLTVESGATTFCLDRDRMLQVLINLVSNAIKFSPDGGIVSISAVESPQGLKICVIDEGRGVPLSHRDAIFEKFQQVEAADGRRKSGTGLGLPICKQIVELHGGKIGVESADGKGSKFWLEIPNQAETKPSDQPAAQSPVKRSNASTQEISSAHSNPLKKSTVAPFALGSSFSLTQKGAVLAGVPIVLGIVFIAILGLGLLQSDRETAKVRHTRAIAVNASKLMTLIYRLGSITAQPPTVQGWLDFKATADEMPRTYDRLCKLAEGDGQLETVLSDLKVSLTEPQAFVTRAEQLVDDLGHRKNVLIQAFKDRETLEPYLAEAFRLLDQLVQETNTMTVDDPVGLAKQHQKQAFLLLLALVFGMVTSILLAVFFSRSITSRLAILRDNTRRLAANQPLSEQLTGNDEIAHLDRVFHSMALTLREARQKERAVFDNSQDIICAVDRSGVVRQVNSACQRLWGYTVEFLQDRSLLEITAIDDRQSTATAIGSELADGEPLTIENRIICKDGSVQDVLWSLSWSASEDLYFGTAHDISKRKELERLKQEFLAMVSHDLRTPLTAIVGVSKLGTAGALGDLDLKVKDSLNTVTTNANRLLDLINDLLDIEKLESGQMQLSLEEVAVSELVEQATKSVAAQAHQANVSMTVKSNVNSVIVDRDRLLQVLSNLLENAITHSTIGDEVLISIEPIEGWIQFKIVDHGPGIPERQRDTLFERYKPLDASTRSSTGSGLGLPICKQIVQCHGGTIGVESTAGGGSTFWFNIPVSTT